jgi:dTDP-4-amino-4,6-dideoxygalactose transaminase
VLDYDSSDRNSHHYIVVEVDERCATARDEIVAALRAENILARKYFWPGCHKMKPYRDLYPHAGLMLRNTETLAAKIIVLPNGAWLNDETIETICDVFSVLTDQ